ncbi:MAG: hypothetical protein MRY83_01465 [Flavobacteriales bacterium]|nr:hypothetical protein [Flavobacteriales bacterium]
MDNTEKRLLILLLLVFGIFGSLTLWVAFDRNGLGFAQSSIQKVFQDPIIVYAIFDLVAIFVILSVWVFKESKILRFNPWAWIVLMFVFGTPAFVIFLFHRKRLLRKKSKVNTI